MGSKDDVKKESLYDLVLQDVLKRKDAVTRGILNCIPSKFKRFKKAFPGVEKKKIYKITSTTKGGKTQFMSDTFIYTPLKYCYNDKNISMKGLMFNFEEDIEDIMKRYLLNTLYDLSKTAIDIDYATLNSLDKDNPINDSIIEFMKSKAVTDRMKFFENNIKFADGSTNIDYVKSKIEEFIQDHYVITRTEVDEFGDGGEIIDIKEKDESCFKIIYIDHISLIEPRRGQTKFDAMAELSGFFVRLRNKYNLTFVVVQQQNMEERTASKPDSINQIKPSAFRLSDNKQIARDDNLIIGLTNPYAYELKSCYDYDITKFKDHFRLIEILNNRNGSQNNIVGLFMRPTCAFFAELPRANEYKELEKFYKQIKD